MLGTVFIGAAFLPNGKNFIMHIPSSFYTRDKQNTIRLHTFLIKHRSRDYKHINKNAF